MLSARAGAIQPTSLTRSALAFSWNTAVGAVSILTRRKSVAIVEKCPLLVRYIEIHYSTRNGRWHCTEIGTTITIMPRPPSPTLLSYLASYDPHVSGLALALRDIVLDEAPEAVESLAKGYAVSIAFSFTGKPMKDGFCHVVTYTNHVNLGFNRGAELPDPNGVLEGTGKMIRHIQILNQDHLLRPYLRRYLQAAIERAPRKA
jgi:hypothetical protein